MDLPLYVKGEFKDFYRAMFDRQVRQEDMRAVFLEYAWDMNWCDPCAADPLSVKELRSLGVFWLGEAPDQRSGKRLARDVFVTRMHVRYDADHFPEDLVFQETPDRSNFQARYVLRHPWKGEADCAAAEQYQRQLIQRREKEAQQLAVLTGWDVNEIRRKMDLNGGPSKGGNGKKPWWRNIWGS